MLVEIPDVGVMIGIFIAFVSGLFAIVIYNKVKPLMKTESDQIRSYIDRLQYYENQLIDMKIRLDSLDLGKEDPSAEILVKAERRHKKQEFDERDGEQKERMPNMNFGSAVDYVLKLITERPMTSRDIQITIGRTREHTSRMMKKLFEEGFVERNMKTKPFTYYITDKGKAKIGLTKIAAQ